MKKKLAHQNYEEEVKKTADKFFDQNVEFNKEV